MQVTQNLLRHAEAKLKNAERALKARPTNIWLTASVEFLQDEVETIRQMQAAPEPKKPRPQR